MKVATGVAWVAALVLVCRASAAEAPKAPPATPFEHDMLVRFHMHENYDLARAAERMLLRGKLEEMRSLAAGIATAPDEAGDPRWAAHGLRVREAAAQLSRARSIPEAAQRDAQLATACAGCHADLGVSPEFATHGKPPPDGPTLEARMLRHQWAAARLWEGILGRADESWRAGLDVLAVSPLVTDDRIAERAPLARRLQQQAAAARRKPGNPDEQAYGEIIATCAGCHVATAKP